MAMADLDHVERLRGHWARELPDLDTTPMAVLGRAYRLSNLIRPGIERCFARFGLDRGEFDVLCTLRRSGAPYRLTPTDLYRSLMISSGGLTHRLVRLEKAGLIRREKALEDGRSLLVMLTEEGVRQVEDAFRADMANEMRFLEGIAPDRRAALAELLKELLLSIEAHAPPEDAGPGAD
ncbi:MarR family transcriptional regulator [Bosea vaviloviae]|nr:MarR family transcriptional regulator [Bosea vaviloviae]